MRLRLDPWPAEYEAAVQLDDSDPEGAPGQVDATVETVDWPPLSGSIAESGACYFVDGVRRVEARVIG